MDKLIDVVKSWIIERLKEKSTYAGLAIILLNRLGLSEEFMGPIERLLADGGGVLMMVINSNTLSRSKMNSLPVIMLLAISLTLTACAGAVPWNKQNYAGLNEWEIKKCISDSGVEYICKAKFIDGKESEAKQLAIQLADGTIIKYSTEGERAFDGFKTRADVEKFVSEQFGSVSKDVVDAISKQMGIN
ncbi:MAG: hypothetical protein JKY34_15880 [Kordiimonadaceae bacterium]|nr:hypothetical protein [Kordiimonadaceae bacterium]